MTERTTLVFASNNKHKVQEISQLLNNKSIQLLSLADLKYEQELPETQSTLEGNALQKARFVFEHFKLNCFADDTGLEIEALDGRPGVLSARYAGEQKSSDDNMNKVLKELDGIENRKAAFRTVIALIMNGKEILFEGIVKGTIFNEKRGNAGFGYDPIFVPEGYNQTFAEMNLEAKNKLSHRATAVKKLTKYLNSL